MREKKTRPLCIIPSVGSLRKLPGNLEGYLMSHLRSQGLLCTRAIFVVFVWLLTAPFNLKTLNHVLHADGFDLLSHFI